MNIIKYTNSKLKELSSVELKIPTIHEFAETLIMPETGKHFELDSQPFIRPIFDAYMNPNFQELWVTGPAQSGKTHSSFVCPCLYALCVLNENVGVGVPSKPMVNDKWSRDLLPILEASKYAYLIDNYTLSIYNSNSVKFSNNRFLKFFLGSARNDSARAGYTVRNLCFTEASSFGGGVSTSEEGNLFSQILSRTLRFGNRRKICCEGVPSIEDGIVWHNIKKLSTNSRVHYKCPKCNKYSIYNMSTYHTPTDVKKEDYVGYTTNCYFKCPECEHRITEDERYLMLENGVLKSERPESNKFGISWGSFDNKFWDLAVIAQASYNAFVDPDQERAQRYLSQHIHGAPYIPSQEDIIEIINNHDPMVIAEKTIDDQFQQFEIPSCACGELSVGVDVGSSYGINYTVSAADENANLYITDYSLIDVDWNNGGELAVQRSIKEMIDLISNQIYTFKNKKITPNIYVIDRGWIPQTVLAAVSPYVNNKNIFLAKGFGNSVKKTKIFKNGAQYEMYKQNGVNYVDHDVDPMKEYLRNRILTSNDSNGRLMLFRRNKSEHVRFIRHLLSEYQIMDEKTGKMQWTNNYRANHYFDSTILSLLGLKILKNLKNININFADDIIDINQHKPTEQQIVTNNIQPIKSTRLSGRAGGRRLY